MKRSVLFIDACVREASRTRRLAKRLLLKLGGPVTEVRLNEMNWWNNVTALGLDPLKPGETEVERRDARRPFFRCPEEYRPYISAEEEARIIGFYKGFWSPRIPVFPVCITVTKADETFVYVRTKYLFFGTAEMRIGRLGSPEPTPSLLTGLRLR